MTFVPVPGIGPGYYGPLSNLSSYLDVNYLPGRLWNGSYDPEGMLSTLPAIGTCLLGVFAGLVLRDIRLRPQQKSLALIAGGVALVLAGHLWAQQFPLIKSIWTSSFVLVTGGYAAMLLGAFHQVTDVWGYTKWATALVWIGANAILLYMLNGLVGFQPVATRLVGGDVATFFDQAVTQGAGAFVTHLVGLAFVVALAGYLYRRKIFLKV
jgi:predicted acyltransferase